MSQSVVELAKELTLALIETGNVPPEDMQKTLQKTYATLTALKAQEESGVFAPAPISETVPVDWRKSITKHAVTCLECGQAFKQLSLRHLGMHGLDSGSYRTKYGIPKTQPLSARSTTERRRQVAQEIRPWEKAPHIFQAREHNGHTSPESEAETVPEETDTPTAEAPAQLKRQRKTSPNKTARKTRSAR
jgi:predicted transcriptional regulator